MKLSFTARYRVKRSVAPCLAFLLLYLSAAGCSKDNNPLSPGGSQPLPVEFASQLEGRWGSVNIFAGGLPVTYLLVPAFAAGRNEARLSAFDTDLVVSVTGEKSGLFSLESSATAADTANPDHTASGTHQAWGGYSVSTDGSLDITLRGDNSGALNPAQSYSGTASLTGDTLILSFTLSVPPSKAVPFLPDTTDFIARLVKR